MDYPAEHAQRAAAALPAGRGQPDDEVIRLSGVGVVREGTRIVHGVDWVVRRNERWVVLGPNGAGKTRPSKPETRRVTVV